MNKTYAQTDELGNVHTVCSLAGDIVDDKIVKIDKFDNKLLGSKYDKVKKEFTKEIKDKDGKVIKTLKYNKNLPDFEEVTNNAT